MVEHQILDQRFEEVPLVVALDEKLDLRFNPLDFPHVQRTSISCRIAALIDSDS